MTHTATPLSRPGRRAVLAGAAASAGTVLFGPTARADARTTGPRTPAVTTAPTGDLAWVATGDAAHVLVPAGLGALLTQARVVPAGTALGVAWDDRLYERSAASLVGDDGRAVRVAVAASAVAASRVVSTVTVGEALQPGRTYRLLLGARRTLRYPRDVVVEPTGTTVRLAGQPAATSAVSAAAPSVSVADTTALWGAAAGAGWRAAALADGRRAWWPELVTIRSTGPAVVPAGTHVDVLLDGRLFSGLRLVTPDGASVPARSVGGTTVRLRWTLAAPLAAGERATARLEGATTSTTSGAPADLQAPTVSVRAGRRSVGQRTTGLESVSRDD